MSTKWENDEPVEQSQYAAFQASNTCFYFLIIGMVTLTMDWYFITALCLAGSTAFFSLSYAYATDGLSRRVWDRVLGDNS